MGRTIGGYGAIFIGACIIWGVVWFLVNAGFKKSVAIILGILVNIVLIFGVFYYYTNTASGVRAYKTQKSELSMGLDRTIKVYDVDGDLIQEYDGKFDITYDENRIMFDDENGKRHIIYYPTGTVIIDEK